MDMDIIFSIFSLAALDLLYCTNLALQKMLRVDCWPTRTNFID